MGTLMSNGELPYCYSRRPLRTPFRKKITLNPIENARLEIAGAYRQNIPTTGFVGSSQHYTETIAMGKTMRRVALGG